ncbi:DUF1885 family protein [Microaerobacter geothermalis]|uniref:DUF1885 family protein n=1 Tax=Microaerobacter geothermalis TaxID=674972 RepID=UPI001F16E435|nr:DUF1885 family protein [Microaerobacter geothermalis]MCF6093538.1 DUF1885 family protein [Microaerobacter geothermalis]
MGKSAYIKFVEGSSQQKATVDDVKDMLNQYIERTSKTGDQLSWHYGDTAFPYTLEEKPEGRGKWFYLKGKDPKLYKYIIIGVGSEQVEADGEVQHYIQIVLPEGSTAGDKGKANEFCKYMARYYKAELHLFNGRVMYFNPRK